VNKLRELAERWKRNDAGDTEIVAYALNEAADELLSILDAEGDGVAAEDAVPRAWISHRRIVGIPDKDFYGKLPIQSMQPGVYSHTPLFDKPPPRPPIIVPPYVSADDANRLYGEQFGVDWKYEAITADTFRKLHPPAQTAQVTIPTPQQISDYLDGLDDIRRAVVEREARAMSPAAEPVAQATTCAGCGKHKPTPLRIDAMGGYVCLTCIDEKLSSLLGEFGYPTQPRAVPDGWVLVPIHATHEMCEAAHTGPNCGETKLDASCKAFWEDCYQAMLAAAPSPGES